MEIQIHNWIFDVNIQLNMEISSLQASEHCTCGYCRNYYNVIDQVCPNLRPFLASNFGVDIEGPDELSPFEPTIYEASYIVNGSILQSANTGFCVDSIPVRVLTSAQADMDTVRPEPYFVLIIGLIQLPWVLDEDPNEVISPANDEAYLQRMQRKLLDRMLNDDLMS